MLALIIGMIIGLITIKGMVWLVGKAKRQQSLTQIQRAPDGSIRIQAGGDINIGDVGTKRKGGHKGPDTIKAVDQYGCEFDYTPPDETDDLKRNLLD